METPNQRTPQAPLEFPWVYCAANMPCSAADMLRGGADTLCGVANTATFTAFTSFLANLAKCF